MEKIGKSRSVRLCVLENNRSKKKQIFGLSQEKFFRRLLCETFLASAKVKKSFAGYAIPESIPTFGANLHRLQLKYTLIPARCRLSAARQIRANPRAGNANRISFVGNDPAFPGIRFCGDAASESSRDFKICLKKEAPRKFLEKKATKQVKKTQKHASGNKNLPAAPIYFKIRNRAALKNP